MRWFAHFLQCTTKLVLSNGTREPASNITSLGTTFFLPLHTQFKFKIIRFTRSLQYFLINPNKYFFYFFLFIFLQSDRMAQKTVMPTFRYCRKIKYTIIFYSAVPISKISAWWTMYRRYQMIQLLCRCIYPIKWANKISSHNFHQYWAIWVANWANSVDNITQCPV